MSNGRAQLIFVNPQEVYYCGGIRELTTTEYLRYYLHLEGYDCVYHLSYDQMGISVDENNEKDAQRFARKGNGLFNKQLIPANKEEKDVVDLFLIKEFRTVVLPEWNKKKSAMTFEINQFCEMISVKENRSVFSDFVKNKKGIARLFLLVDSINENHLTDSNLKEVLDESLIRLIFKNERNEASIRDTLRNNEADDCLFLDRLTREDVKSVLLNVVVKSKDRFETIGDIDQMIDYLNIITDEAVPPDPEFEINYKLKSRKDCYDYLESRQVWKNLCRNSQYASSEYIRTVLLENETASCIADVIVKRCVEVWEKRDSDQNNYIKYCILRLCRELKGGAYKSQDFETKKLIFRSIDEVYLEFSQRENIRIKDRRFIAGDYLGYFFDCFERTNKVYELKASFEIDKVQSQAEANAMYYYKDMEKEAKKMFIKLLEIKEYLKQAIIMNNEATRESFNKSVDDFKSEFQRKASDDYSFNPANKAIPTDYEYRIDEI